MWFQIFVSVWLLKTNGCYKISSTHYLVCICSINRICLCLQLFCPGHPAWLVFLVFIYKVLVWNLCKNPNFLNILMIKSINQQNWNRWNDLKHKMNVINPNRCEAESILVVLIIQSTQMDQYDQIWNYFITSNHVST